MKHLLTHHLRSYLADPGNWVKNVQWRFPKTIAEKEFVFIVGAPRSGTTLLQRILCVHPSFFSIEGETKIFTARNIFSHNHFGLSQEQLAHLFESSQDTVDYFERGATVLGVQNGGRTFVEKTPSHVLRIQFLLKHFPNAKFVNIFRDGRDCYCSALQHPGIPQSRSVSSFASYWSKSVSCWLAVNRLKNTYQLKYEDLTSNPELEISKLMHHLGSSPHDSQLDPKALSSDRRAEGKAHSKLKQPINPGSCGRWKSELSPDDNRVFEQISGRQLQLLGYLLEAQQGRGTDP